MTGIGQYPEAAHALVHMSDTHFVAGGEKLFGTVATERNLLRAFEQLERSGIRPEAIVFTGDLADRGEPDAYRRLRAIVEPAANRLGAEVIWVMGNHDERSHYSRELFGIEDDLHDGEKPQDRVYDLAGLRVVSLDTTVPGYHHGEVSDAQREWLAEVLAEPAPHGTLVAMHHPPIPMPLIWVMQTLELQGQDRLATILQGTDVRGILAGHLHFSTHSTFAGIPVSVVAANCYTMDLMQEDKLIAGVDGGQAFATVHVYEDRVVHTTIPIGEFPDISSFAANHREQIEALTPEERLEMFSRKDSAFNRGELNVDRTFEN